MIFRPTQFQSMFTFSLKMGLILIFSCGKHLVPKSSAYPQVQSANSCVHPAPPPLRPEVAVSLDSGFVLPLFHSTNISRHIVPSPSEAEVAFRTPSALPSAHLVGYPQIHHVLLDAWVPSGVPPEPRTEPTCPVPQLARPGPAGGI